MRPNIALTVLLFAITGGVSAQDRASDFQVTKITRNLIASPEYNFTGAENFHTNTRDRWLEVEVQFSAAPAFTGELTLKYFILLNDQLLTGEVAHVNIVGGKELRSVVYVSPRALAHFLGNRTFTINNVQNIAVQILEQGVVQDELSLARGAAEWFSALPQVSGFVLNKNETPFAPLYWDRYEQIKPAGH